ncbi:MAG TPA: NAD(P)H-dependent oxidoreductase subunit E, partial [Thermodesulfobacteriota bacterium]
MRKIQSASDLHQWREQIRSRQRLEDGVVYVCGGTGCQAYGCQKVKEAFEKELKALKTKRRIALKVTGCRGFCEKGPLVTLHPQDLFYHKVKPEDVPRIVAETILKGKVVEDLLLEDPAARRRILSSREVPFYRSQMRLLLGNNEFIDPTRIGDYVAMGGYEALAKAVLQMSPEEVICEIRTSGLRGRGGAGYPT